MGKLKSCPFSLSFVLNWSSLSISRCRSRYVVGLAISVVFQAQWDRCYQHNHQTLNYLVKGHQLCPLQSICVANDYRYVPSVHLEHSSFTGFITRVTWRVPHGVPFRNTFGLGLCCSIFSFLCNELMIVVCPFVLFFLPLYCLSFNLRYL
jgi:hypothetical protein